MSRVKKIVSLLVFVPLAILLIVLSVANRQTVTLALNPFQPQDSMLSLSAPFFLFLFLTLIVGMFIGSLVTWFGQGRYRKQARAEARAAIERNRQVSQVSAAKASPARPVESSALLPAAKG